MKSSASCLIAGLAFVGVCAASLWGGEASTADKPQAKTAPRGKQQALFDRINVAEAWKVTKGDPKVLIGVIDNGFDFFHPDLKGQLIPGYYFPGAYHTECYENIAHGTLVSSIMVAKGDSPDAMAGLAPRCRVLTASQGTLEHALVKLQRRILAENPKATMTDIQKEMRKHAKELGEFGREWVRFQAGNAADAIRYLVDHGAKVINISGGLTRSLCPFPDVWQKLEDAFAYAARKNVVIVLGAGNNAAQWDDYPGRSDTVIVAGATLLDDSRWQGEVEPVPGLKVKQGSNFGKRLTVMAPVEKLLVCVPHEQRVYTIDDGPAGPSKEEFKGKHDVLPVGATSCAAPIVSALVALIYSIRPDLDAKSVVEIVKKGCDDIGDKGYDIYTGHGRVNFGKSIKLAQQREAFTGEPAARDLYVKLLERVRKADSFCYESEYRWSDGQRHFPPCRYRVWLKKPGLARVEGGPEGAVLAVLVGDGETFWAYWPKGRPRLMHTEDPAEYEKTRHHVYTKEQIPAKSCSLAHRIGRLGPGMSMPVLNPSCFFEGFVDSLEPYLDGAKGLGVEKIGDDPCDVIEVSFMQHQRSRYLWIARRDGLPRKLKEVVRVASGEIVAEELWTNVKVDGEIPNTMFSWKPPEGWREWRLPEPESLLLKPGTLAPPFELSGADGARIKLSDLRGKVVWLVFWRIGCPPCYEEIPHLERLHRKYGPRGLVILGFNFADEKERALEFLAERSVTYPSIVDSSDAAQKTCLEHYHVMGVPTHYVIDREGKIADAWGGVNKADEAYAEKRLLRLVKKLGLD